MAGMIGLIMTFVAMLIAFGLGVVFVLFTGGKTTLQYLQCKMKRTKKIFIWVDSFTGRESVVGTIEGDIKKGIVSWKFNGAEQLTKITKDNVKRWKDVYYMAVNLDCPMVAYNQTKLGEMPLSSIDLKEFQNILNRALTKPSLDDDLTYKILIGLGFGLLVVVAILVVLFFKIDTLSGIVEGLNVL